VLNEREPGFGVYIHWPFCAQKCPYCDFNSHVRFGGWDEPRFLAAYKRELDHIASLTGPRTVSSIFFGGGTPSLMQASTVGAILDHIASHWSIDPKAEVTLEANPGSVEAERFQGYRDAGVNRVSIGVQSFRDGDLKRLGRIHSVEEAKAAIGIAARTFERFSFDLIYARPGQTVAEWREELQEAMSLSGNHLSLYQLTIEPDTPFFELHRRGKLVIPEAEAASDLYEATQELCDARGLAAYEVSNHARPGEESRHNLLYWRYGEYAGIGPGAHGRLISNGQRYATSTEKAPEAWVASVEQRGHGFASMEALTDHEAADEMLLMGLRLSEGLDLERLEAVGGVRPSAAAIDALEAGGFIERMSAGERDKSGLDEIQACLGPGLAPASLPPRKPTGRLRATGRGRFILNELVLRLSQGFEISRPS
jgi:oxygen-independent coproporphyrinogen-3 oxidase